jgi:hypothetical protein
VVHEGEQGIAEGACQSCAIRSYLSTAKHGIGFFETLVMLTKNESCIPLNTILLILLRCDMDHIFCCFNVVPKLGAPGDEAQVYCRNYANLSGGNQLSVTN